MSYKIKFQQRAQAEYQRWKRDSPRHIKKIDALIEDIQRDPYSGLGKPEQLEGGCWSRRIDKKNRIIYDMIDDLITVYSCCGHYDDL